MAPIDTRETERNEERENMRCMRNCFVRKYSLCSRPKKERLFVTEVWDTGHNNNNNNNDDYDNIGDNIAWIAEKLLYHAYQASK